jgi:hypothetical protein
MLEKIGARIVDTARKPDEIRIFSSEVFRRQKNSTTKTARHMRPVCVTAVRSKRTGVLKIFCTDDRARAPRTVGIDQN